MVTSLTALGEMERDTALEGEQDPCLGPPKFQMSARHPRRKGARKAGVLGVHQGWEPGGWGVLRRGGGPEGRRKVFQGCAITGGISDKR